MKQLMSKRLPHTMENVCLSTDEDCQMYAVGSKVSLSIIMRYLISETFVKCLSIKLFSFIQALIFVTSGSHGSVGQQNPAASEEDPIPKLRVRHQISLLQRQHPDHRHRDRADAVLGPEGQQVPRKHHELQQVRREKILGTL